MRFRNIFFLFILITGFTFSQVTNEGQPLSWTLNLETANIQEKTNNYKSTQKNNKTPQGRLE